MPFYQKGDTRINYEEAGSGFPLLIIPGGGLNSTASNGVSVTFRPGNSRFGESKSYTDPIFRNR